MINKNSEDFKGIQNFKVPIYTSTHIPIHFFSLSIMSLLQRKEFNWRFL